MVFADFQIQDRQVAVMLISSELKLRLDQLLKPILVYQHRFDLSVYAHVRSFVILFFGAVHGS